MSIKKGFETGVDRWIADNNPASYHTLGEYVQKMRNGFWEGWYIDVVLDKYMGRNGDYSLHDAYVFAIIHTMIHTGQIAVCQIEVHETPGKDSNTDHNNTVLNDLPDPFTGMFCGGPGDNDGYIEWNSGIIADKMTQPNNKAFEEVCIKSGFAPLEVGYTEAHTTLFHLISERCLARWPYGHSKITLLFVIDENVFRHPDDNEIMLSLAA